MRYLEQAALWVVPLLLLGTAFLMVRRRALDSFLTGAREGLSCGVGLLPTLILLMSGVSMLEASGAMALLSRWLEGGLGRLGIPPELTGLLLTRPVSGSASTALFAELAEKLGADSFPVLCASVIMGSSDTVIYVLGVYLGAAGVRRSGYAMPVAFLGMIFQIVFACLLCRLFFGG